MGTGIGKYCKRCGEQLNYDDGFEDGFCNRCYHIVKFENRKLSEQPEKQEEWREVAKLFHDTYERLAPEYGYTTREDTKEFDPNTSNGKLMVAVCKEVISQLLSEMAREVKIQQLKEDIEQVEIFLPKMASDTPEYWIPTQILLELEKDLSKLLENKE